MANLQSVQEELRPRAVPCGAEDNIAPLLEVYTWNGVLSNNFSLSPDIFYKVSVGSFGLRTYLFTSSCFLKMVHFIRNSLPGIMLCFIYNFVMYCLSGTTLSPVTTLFGGVFVLRPRTGVLDYLEFSLPAPIWKVKYSQ